MLSAAGLSGATKPRALGLAPPPGGTGKIRSPLPPPPNDPVAARIVSSAPKETTRRPSADSFSDFSQLEVCDSSTKI